MRLLFILLFCSAESLLLVRFVGESVFDCVSFLILFFAEINFLCSSRILKIRLAHFSTFIRGMLIIKDRDRIKQGLVYRSWRWCLGLYVHSIPRCIPIISLSTVSRSMIINKNVSPFRSSWTSQVFRSWRRYVACIKENNLTLSLNTNESWARFCEDV